jgi:regulator of protease activity HflC (stomatin/prohibitin superfamily)
MNRTFKLAAVAALVAATVGCTRIETGEVGVRVGFDKQVKPGELMPGSFNQVMIGEVLTFPIRDVSVTVDNLTPLAKDNSTMKDMDVTIIYNINPNQVSEIYTSKNRGFHSVAKDGDTYLMYNYIAQAARNAAYKAARKYDALTMNDSRASMEQEMREIIGQTLAEEKLGNSITITQVLIRQITPADSVVASANELVRSKNELLQKEVEVKTAEAESRRMAALTNQSAQSIQYMQAQAMLNISEGIKNGRVNTVVVPADFRGMVNIGAK